MLRLPKSRKKRAILLGLLVLVGVFAFLEFTGRTEFILNRGPVVDKVSKTTSDTPSAQSDFDSGDDRSAAQSTNKPQINVADTQGSDKAPNGSAPTTSQDSIISVYSPAPNGLFVNGASLTGKSSAAKVSYRLMDDVSGVTATGDLMVINGSFSGKFSFSTSASVGRLDVFQISTGGVERSIVEIPVRFK